MKRPENPEIEQLREQTARLEGRLDALSAILHASMVTTNSIHDGYLKSVNGLLVELASAGDVDGPAILHEFRKISGHG